MSVIQTTLIPAKFAEDAQTTQTTLTSARTIIDKFTVTNNGSVAATISVNLVAASDAASTANRVVNEKVIQVGEDVALTSLAGQVLQANGFISTIADTASTLTIMASGRLVS